jgi:TrmH family RNA methyltransferase
MKFEKYDRRGSVGYAPGVFPSLELMRARPDAVRALVYHPDGLRNEGLQRLIADCREMGVPAEEAPRALQKIDKKGNIYAALAFLKYADELQVTGDHVALCGISDMGNLGTILRTALGFGVRDIALVGDCADPFDPRAVRASMGAVFHMRVREYKDFADYEASAGARECYFFRLKNARPLDAVRRGDGPASLVFGGEASGLTGDLLLRETGVVIPHGDAIDSLNLAVAAGIAIYTLRGIS